MPIKVTYQNPVLESDENMVCEDFLNMGMLPLELSYDIYTIYIYTGDINIYYHIMTLPYITTYYHMFVVVHTHQLAKSPYHPEKKRCKSKHGQITIKKHSPRKLTQNQ